MRSTLSYVTLFVIVSGISGVALADEKSSAEQATHELTALSEILERVSRNSGKEFLIDRRVQAEVVTGTLEVRQIDYEILLSILRNNGLAAIPTERATKIVPVGVVRQGALPVVRDSDPSIPHDEWVTRVITLEKIHAPALVPVLRPMIQKEGHLVAVAGSNLLMIVAPYGVTERLVDVAREADRKQPDTKPQP